jgi:hypothetical protein
MFGVWDIGTEVRSWIFFSLGFLRSVLERVYTYQHPNSRLLHNKQSFCTS